MKRNRRRLPIPQHEFGFAANSFNLIQETSLDGQRLSREREAARLAREKSEAAQAGLFGAKGKTVSESVSERPEIVVKSSSAVRTNFA